jgi:hypothetical protein
MFIRLLETDETDQMPPLAGMVLALARLTEYSRYAFLEPAQA